MAIKRTDEERRQRELNRKAKIEELKSNRESGRDELSPGGWIKKLIGLYRFDEDEIFNIVNNDKILEAVLEMRESIEEKHWENVIRKSINQTKVRNKDKAFKELSEYLFG